MSDDAVRFLNAILGEDGAYLEIRAFGAGKTVQKFFTNAEEAADYALRLDDGDLGVFVGMAPRDKHAGTAEAVSEAYVVSADCDDDASVDALATFPIAPSILVESGGTTKGGKKKLHAHWLVDKIDANTLVDVKVDLCRALRSDPKIVDAPRVMRLPGTTNRKPAKDGGGGPVRIINGDQARVDLAELRAACHAVAPRVDTRAADIFGNNGLDLPDVIQQGQRDDLLFKYACRQRGKGHDEAEIYALLVGMNSTRVDPPMTERDLRRIARSACKKPQGNGEPEPEEPELWLPSERWSVFRGRVDERVAYLIHELVIQGGLGVIGAPAKAGKTWIAELMAVCLATGTTFLHWDIPEPVKVLYLALEGSASGHKKRFAVLARGLGLDPDQDETLGDNLEIVTQPPSGLNLVNKEHGARFVERVVDGGFAASFVDVVRAAAKIRETGEGAVDIRQLQANLRPLVDVGHTTTFVHHAKKYEAANRGAYVPALERLSGSGDWGGVVDFGLVLDKDKRGWRHARLHVEGRDIPTPNAAHRIEYRGEGSGKNGGILYEDTITAHLVVEEEPIGLDDEVYAWLLKQTVDCTTAEILAAFPKISSSVFSKKVKGSLIERGVHVSTINRVDRFRALS